MRTAIHTAKGPFYRVPLSVPDIWKLSTSFQINKSKVTVPQHPPQTREKVLHII
jgi:hypothetical protein